MHTLRGPRQVGKSTDLKLLAQRALKEGFAGRRVVYLTLELLEGQSLPEVAATIQRAKALARGDRHSLVLLDEVTFVDGWQTAIKSLWDDGTIDEDVVVCTGSSAIDLREGTADRLPGRRGPGQDFSIFPQSFAAFARALDPAVPESPRHSIATIASDAGWEALEDMRIHLRGLDEALDLYMRFGGLPAAVAEAIGGATAPSEETKTIAYDSLLREIQRKQASRPAAHALLERVLRSLGSKTSWTRMAREMAVELRPGPGRASVRDYVELLASAYSLLIVYFWRSDSDSPELSKDKKLYFADPVGLHVWQTRRSGEIDFVCGPRAGPDLVEVKHQSNPDLRQVAAIPRAFPQRPVILATKDKLERRSGYALVPAALLLWALG